MPDFITKDHYSDVRNSYNKKDNKFEDWYIGAVGFLASYNGRFFDGGYAGLVQTKAGTTRNYYDEAKRNLQEQANYLKDIEFRYGDYKQFSDVQNALIYCDIPYYGTKQYGVSKNFNYNEFWLWVKNMSKKNIVIVSEENAPNDISCIWEENITRTIDNNKRKYTVEKLYMYEDSQ